MPTERLLMRQIREILRLRWACGLPQRAVARACGVGLGTVSDYCCRATQAGLSWPLPDELDDAQLEAHLFQRGHDLVGVPRPLSEMAWLHQELDGRRREHRLPHRGRAQLLQRPLSAASPARRGPADGHDHRGLSQRPADRLPSSAHGARPGLHPARTYAARPPGACGMDALPAHRVGGEDRVGHRAGRVRHPCQ